jgi:hypothetical protein
MNAILALATLVAFTPASERRSDSFRQSGNAACFKLAVPAKFHGFNKRTGEYEERTTRYVWISTSCIMGQWETYAFPAYSNGKVHCWHEMYASMRHDADEFADPIAEVLKGLGYAVPSTNAVAEAA